MEEQAGYLFYIFGLGVTSRVTTMWGIMIFIVIMSLLATRNMKRLPSGVQNIMEMTVQMLLDFFASVMGYENARVFLPFLGTIFLFILVSNYSGLIPGSGHVTGFAAPTSAWSVTAGLAIVVFFSTHIIGVRRHGIGYLKQFLQPVPFLLPLNIIEHFVRPLSLSLRLFGNIFGEEMLIAILLSLVPYFLPIPVMALAVLFGLVQAVVFTILAAIYFYEAVED